MQWGLYIDLFVLRLQWAVRCLLRRDMRQSCFRHHNKLWKLRQRMQLWRILCHREVPIHRDFAG